MKYYVDSYANLIVGYDNRIESIKVLNDPINNIYRGSVQKKVKGIGNFINLEGYTGFTQEKISQNEGENILVKVVKVPDEEDKALKVTTTLSVTGLSMILFDDDFVKASSKMDSQKKQELLNWANENSFKGILFRTESQNKSFEDLKSEYFELLNKLNDLKLEINRLPTPKLIYSEPITDRIDLAKAEEILFNDRELYLEYKDIGLSKLDTGFRLKYNPQLIEGLNSLVAKEIVLKNGGSIVIEKTLALTVIDVNSKGYNGNAINEVAKKINLEATEEVIRQILLRNISGSIIIDYIDTKEENRTEILNLLKKELKRDGKNTKVHGFTRLGLMELSRKNRGEELVDTWTR